MVEIILIGVSIFTLLLVTGIAITGHDKDPNHPTTSQDENINN